MKVSLYDLSVLFDDDGKVYAVNVLMALHPQDRCTMIPNVRGFPPMQYQTGREWFETLEPETQRRLMGPTRFDAWQDGQFEFEQLAQVRDNDIWGPSAVVTPLRDLLN